MKFRVEYAPRTLRDFIGIRDFIIEESAGHQIAERFFSRLLDACETLSSLPERFPPYPFARNWRMMPFGNYLVFFQTKEDTVRIGHIRHAARRPFQKK